MELCKENLFNIQCSTEPITKNFTDIENQFKKINESITRLRNENDRFKTFQDLVQKLFSNNQFKTNILKLNTQNNPNTKNNNEISQNDSKQSREANQQNNQSQKSILLGDINNAHKNVTIVQTKSQTVISNQDQQILSVMNDLSNIPQMNKNTSSQKEQRSSKADINGLLNGKKATQIDSGNSNKHSLPQNKTLLQQIIQIRERMEDLDQNDTQLRDQIQKLDKENQKFRKILGVKKPAIKQKGSSNFDGSQTKSKKLLNSFSKKTINSQINLEAQSQKSNNLQDNLKQEDDDGMDFQCFKDLREDIEKIRDYLNGKMKAIDTNFAEVNIKIHGIQRNIDILERTQNSMKEDIEYLQQTSNQTKLNITQLNQKSMQMTKSRFKKQFNNNNEQNQQNQKPQIQIQQRIIGLLDEMQQLKDQYQEILFGKKQNENTQQQLDPLIAQKRKKLALRLNNNTVPDQKIKKQLTNCRRDLKKLRQQFDYLMNGVNTGTHQTKTLIIKPNQTKQQWKNLSTKINKFKTQLQSQIKDLQGKITANNQLAVVLNQFEVGIQECKILLKKKLDITDFDKTTKRVEGRLNNFIRQTFQKQGYTNQQDAILSKQPWFCLSCDVELKTYSGKMNKNSPNQTSTGDKFMGKKVNPESHMVRRNQNGRLPSIAL